MQRDDIPRDDRASKIREASDRAMKRRREQSKAAFASNRAMGIARQGKHVVEQIVERGEEEDDSSDDDDPEDYEGFDDWLDADGSEELN